MIEVIVFSLLVLYGLASPGISGVSPETMYDSGFLASPPPPCRVPTIAEQKARELIPKGKATTFSLDGDFLCDRQIFDYGERDSYVDFVLQQASLRAPVVARQAATLAAGEPELRNRFWVVEVVGGPLALRAHLRHVYQGELGKVLGAGRVERGQLADLDPSSKPPAKLKVGLRAVQDADLLFDVTVESLAKPTSGPAPAPGETVKDLSTWQL